MELNQLLQSLLSPSGAASSRGSEKLLAQLTRAVDSQQTQKLLQLLKPLLPQTPNSASTRLPLLPVSAKLQPPPQPGQPPQLRLQPTDNKLPSVQLPLTKSQLATVKSQLPKQANQQLVMLVKPGTTATPAPKLELQLVTINNSNTSKAQSLPSTRLEMPVQQLPKPIARALVSQLTSTADAKPAMIQPAPASPVKQRPLALKQAQQLSPQQFRQALQQVVTPTIRSVVPQPATGSASPATTPLNTPQQAVTRVLQAVVQQLPKADAMQQPQALKQWVNDWFAAKPVSQSPAQQMGGLGKMLVMLLGFARQQSTTTTSSAPTQPSSQSFNQLTQALLDQVLRPAPRFSNEPAFSGEVRERINQLLQQLPQTQLQRLMQLFTGAVNNAQTSQARLADSPVNQPEYFILLPTSQQQPEQTQLLIRRDAEPGSDGEPGRTVWLFTLRFELQQHGPLLVKGRYHPAGTRVDFYTESSQAEQALQARLGELEQRFAELEVSGLNLTVQQGKVPESLAQQQSGIIRVTV